MVIEFLTFEQLLALCQETYLLLTIRRKNRVRLKASSGRLSVKSVEVGHMFSCISAREQF